MSKHILSRRRNIMGGLGEANRPRRMTSDNSRYEERALFQLELWRRGLAVHNDIDDECCPDFSCCRGPKFLASPALREMFVRDPASRSSMMAAFTAELPDEVRILYDLPGQIVVKLEWQRDQ